MNKQIAGEIGVSEITVKIHRGHVMRKMGAKSLADLVRMAETLGVSRAKALAGALNLSMSSPSWPRRRNVQPCLVDASLSVAAHFARTGRLLQGSGGLASLTTTSPCARQRHVSCARWAMLPTPSPRPRSSWLALFVDETSCVIADVQMPQLSGLELQNRLRAEGYDTPIIFITAFPEEKSEPRALTGGAVCFLNKPFDGQC